MTTPNRRSNAKSIDTANEEWSEILAVTTEASITTPLQLRLAPCDPTPLEIDVNTALSAQDLNASRSKTHFFITLSRVFATPPFVSTQSTCIS